MLFDKTKFGDLSHKYFGRLTQAALEVLVQRRTLVNTRIDKLEVPQESEYLASLTHTNGYKTRKMELDPQPSYK